MNRDLLESDAVSVARSICLTQLTRGPRTRAQLAATLAKRLVPEEAATQAIERLAEVGLVDDAAYARAWVESRQASRGLSSRALTRELRDRGVPADLIDDALVDVTPDHEEEAALALAERRLRTLRGLPVETQVRRTVGLLGRRGYAPRLAYRVVRTALDAAGHPPTIGPPTDD